MTVYDPILDDPDDLGADLSGADLGGEEPDPEVEAAEAAVDELAILADEYGAADPRRRREMWARLDPDEQDHLRAMGIAGPVTAAVDQDFEPLEPGAPGYRSIVAQSATIVHAGLRQIRSGDLDVDETLAAEIADLAERADRFDDETPVRGKLLQHAAHLLEQAKQASLDAIPFNEDLIYKRIDHGLQADGTYLFEEQDRRGRVRHTSFTAAEIEAAEAELLASEGAGPVPNPDSVTLEEAAAWDWPTTKRFMEAHPEAWERFLQGASIRMMSGER